jgi:hypothetical protein
MKRSTATKTELEESYSHNSFKEQHELSSDLPYNARVHTSSLKHVGIALATLAGVSISAAVLWALYGNALIPPERLLPAETAAVLRGADVQTQRILRQWIPSLKTAPETAPSVTVAIMPVNGKLEWVTLTPGRQLGSGPYRIDASSPAARALVGKGKAVSLERSPKYAPLLAVKPAEGAWAYADPELLGTGAILGPWPWLRVGKPLSFALTPSGIDVTMTDDAPSGIPTFSTHLPLAFEKPLFVAQVTDPLEWLKRAALSTDPTFALIAESLLADRARSRIGRDVSLAYDIMPLLRGETTLHLAQDPRTGATRYVVEGETGRGGHERLEALADAFAAGLPAVRRETVTFEQGFSADMLSQDASVIEEKTFSWDGWDVRSVRHAETGDGFAVAVKD